VPRTSAARRVRFEAAGSRPNGDRHAMFEASIRMWPESRWRASRLICQLSVQSGFRLALVLPRELLPGFHGLDLCRLCIYYGVVDAHCARSREDPIVFLSASHLPPVGSGTGDPFRSQNGRDLFDAFSATLHRSCGASLCRHHEMAVATLL